MIWTEIVAEDVGVVHVGSRAVMVPLADDVDPSRAREVEDRLVRGLMSRYVKRRWREIEQNMKEREQARERLRDAGYDDKEIPL